MPELPEVETIARQLGPLITGKELLGVEILDEKLGEGSDFAALSGEVIGVTRWGKQLRVTVTIGGKGSRACVRWENKQRRNKKDKDTETTRNGFRPDGVPRGIDLNARERERNPTRYSVLLHLRMTGRLIWSSLQRSTNPKGRSPFIHPVTIQRARPRAVFRFRDGALSFYDPRRFGTLELFDEANTPPPRGIDPLSSDFTLQWLAMELTTSRQALKPYLLRQDRLLGIGNIYACEILFAARLNPFRQGSSLKPREVRRLFFAIRSVLLRAIDCSGTTISDYRDTSGDQGSFQACLQVYDREGRRCQRCRGKIRRVMQQQRSTYFCPRCQQ